MHWALPTAASPQQRPLKHSLRRQQLHRQLQRRGSLPPFRRWCSSRSPPLRRRTSAKRSSSGPLGPRRRRRFSSRRRRQRTQPRRRLQQRPALPRRVSPRSMCQDPLRGRRSVRQRLPSICSPRTLSRWRRWSGMQRSQSRRRRSRQARRCSPPRDPAPRDCPLPQRRSPPHRLARPSGSLARRAQARPTSPLHLARPQRSL